MNKISNFLKFLRQSKTLSLWHKFRQQIQDQKQNRQCIGQDRFGNKYYQYYSYYGLPIRRQIRFKNQLDFQMRDLVYYQWLHHQVFDPPTQLQKQQFYLEQKKRYERAMEWDQKQARIMLEFRRKREEMLLRDQAMKQIQDQFKGKDKLVDIKTKRQE